MKKTLLATLVTLFCVGGVLWWYFSQHPAGVPQKSASSTGSVAAGTNLPSVLARPVKSASREMDLKVNPYAASLREPGKFKREWDVNFIDSFQQAKNGDPVQFELTGGVMAQGVVKIIQNENGKLTYVSGELTAPETGKFFFLTPPVGGKAGKAVGVVEFPASKTAYRVEPTGPNGDPELWQRQLGEVICLDMPAADPALIQAAAQATNETENLIPLRPDLVPDYVPSYNSNVVSLQSYPGSPAVLLLDFFGGYTPTWGGVNYAKPPVNNATIKDIWKRVSEDYMPFNINVTTDLKVYQTAAEGSRQRCCFTTTPVTAAGVAYFGSWNWGGDTPCWSVYYVGKAAAEVAAHEPGHTLGLAHQTQDIPNGTNAPTHVEYYGGQGSGETGWAPIMGVGYYLPLTTWAKGEYQYAGQTQDELLTITTANNNVHYRTDDTGSTLATSRYLEVYTNNSAFAEGVIEQTADTDAFQFTTTGGAVSLTARSVAVGDWGNLALMATLADATDTVIASNNVQSSVSATITTNLPAGTYTFRVKGSGKNNVLTDGFSSYGSLGYYSITGSVANVRQPSRLTVAEHAPNNTLVGSVAANNPNSSPLTYAILSGNTGGTFSIDNNGVVRVANNTLLDYYKLATNTSTYAAQFEIFMNITNLNDPSLTETNRRVVIAVQKVYAPVPTALAAAADTCLRIDLSWLGSLEATSYNVKRSTTHGGNYTTIATTSDTSYTDVGLTDGVTYYYVVSAVNANGESNNSSEASATPQVIGNFGFETPTINGHQYNPSGGCWTFNGASPNGSGILANGSAFSNPNAPEGRQAGFVQGYGVISQVLSGFTPGTSYTVSYLAAQRPGPNGSESWNVMIDNTVIRSNSPGGTSYANYTATFIATAGAHKLSFVGTDLAANLDTVFIDNVRISPALRPVAPSVTLTSPTEDVVLVAPATVNLAAGVITNGNVINGVQFYSDTGFIAQITNAPYMCAWPNVGAGIHKVFARVIFNDSSFADSAPVKIAVINLNMNLGFESPSFGSSSYVYDPSGASWTFGGLSGNGSGILANGSAFSNPNAPEGVQAAFLQGSGTISQTLSGFVPGTNYTISYLAAQRSGSAQQGGEPWDVMIDKNVIQSNSPGATSYTSYTATFTASAATHTLSFVGRDPADNTVFIDNVKINPPIAPDILKMTPVLVRDTSPATAATVVGDIITYTAAFSNTPAAYYQWQVLKGGVVSDIPGATNSILTITNLQLSDSGLYRLEAINATNSLGVAYSTTSPLDVSSAPAAVNNVITSCSAQTGLGSAFTSFVPTWKVAPGSLISGQTPSSVGGGNFSLNGSGSVAVLTDGSFGSFNYIPGVGSSSTEVTCGSSAGQSVTYTLPSSASGYILTNIVVCGGWGDAGRDQQAYTVSYSTVAAPTNFIQLSAVNYNPVNAAAVQSATRVTLTPATGSLASNVAAVKFDFTTPSGENGYCGYSEICLYGTSPAPALAANTSPVTASDVVGSQVTFVAGFSGADLVYQWKKVSGGVTNNIAGATNTMLTLTNLKLADAGSYWLQASNSLGVVVSSPSSLTVSSVPGAVNNVITTYAGQTGQGGACTNFVPTWTVAPGSLIAGMSPSSVGGGNFSLYFGTGVIVALTDGTFGSLNFWPGVGSSTTEVICGTVAGGAGQSVTYTLPSSPKGYNLTNITVYGGWGDAGRDQQAYTVYYSKVSAPATFLFLGSVNYNPVNTASVQSATRATLRPASGSLATNVAAVKFDFTIPAPENGSCGYSEISIFGVPVAVPPATNPTNITFQIIGNDLALNWPADHIGWRLQAQTNSLAQGLGTNWVDVPGSTATNQMSLPINPDGGSVFYRMINP